MLVIGVAAGFLGGGIVIAAMIAVGTSGWWHRRRHNDGLHIHSCDHCYKLWLMEKQ